MKRVLFSLAVLAAAVAPAEDVISSSNVLGLLPVTSSAKRTIVAVPWCAMSATDDAAIQVSNVVKTANLTAGDMLYYVQANGTATAWRLAGTDVLYWESVILAAENSVTVSDSAHNQTVARGGSIVLVRKDTPSSAFTFYLYGQVGTLTQVSSPITKGTSAAEPAYSLIASPKVAAWSVNDASATWANVGANDNIFIPSASGPIVTLYWNSVTSKWCEKVDQYTEIGGISTRTGTVLTEYTANIPAGQGVWYVSNGGDATPTLTWNNL